MSRSTSIGARRRRHRPDQAGRGAVPPKPAPTVADLADRFLEGYVAVRCKPGTAKNYRLAIQHHILPALGKKALKDVGPEDVTALHHALRDRPTAAKRSPAAFRSGIREPRAHDLRRAVLR